jgi:beta-glucosidase
VAVVLASDLTTEGSDRTSLALPGDQDRLIAAVANANKHTVVVLNTSSAVLMPWLRQVDGMLEVWYPGQEYGTALAHVLFGDVNPSGKLPLTFPDSDTQGPAGVGSAQYPGDGSTVRYDEGVLVGYRWYDATGQRPLFRFGYGLSYTSFRFSDLDVKARGFDATVTVRITNTGRRSGAEVAQLYVSPPDAAGQGNRVLKAFQKVTLAPGASTTVTFTLSPDDLTAWSSSSRSWTSVPGHYKLRVGSSSDDQLLVTGLKLPAAN